MHNLALVPILIHQQKARHPAQTYLNIKWPTLWKPSGLVVLSWPPAMLAGHWDSMKPPFLCSRETQLLLSSASSPLWVQDRHKYTCVLSWESTSRPKDGASKRLLPALLNVNGSNYSVFQPPPVPLSALQVQLSPPQTWLRPEQSLLLGAGSDERHITHALSQQSCMIKKHTLCSLWASWMA